MLTLPLAAFAQEPAPVPEAPVDVAPVEAAPLVPADPEALLHLARERLRHGDYDGVRILSEEALAIPGDHERTAQYLVAMSWEFGGDPQRALAIYDALEGAYADGEVPDDVRFRRAECLGRLQRFDEARAELDRLPGGDRPPLDQLKIDVLHALWDRELGKRRRAYRELVAALDGAPDGVGTYYQAAGHHALLASAVEAANGYAFVGSDRAKRKALQKRAALLQVANDELALIVRTEEATFALDGFILLAHAYRALGQDMLDESPLKGLTDEQLALNRQLLAEQVEQVWTRGTLYYDRGLQLAAKLRWTTEPVPTMVAEYEALVAEVDALTP